MLFKACKYICTCKCVCNNTTKGWCSWERRELLLLFLCLCLVLVLLLSSRLAMPRVCLFAFPLELQVSLCAPVCVFVCDSVCVCVCLSDSTGCCLWLVCSCCCWHCHWVFFARFLVCLFFCFVSSKYFCLRNSLRVCVCNIIIIIISAFTTTLSSSLWTLTTWNVSLRSQNVSVSVGVGVYVSVYVDAVVGVVLLCLFAFICLFVCFASLFLRRLTSCSSVYNFFVCFLHFYMAKLKFLFHSFSSFGSQCKKYIFAKDVNCFASIFLFNSFGLWREMVYGRVGERICVSFDFYFVHCLCSVFYCRFNLRALCGCCSCWCCCYCCCRACPCCLFWFLYFSYTFTLTFPFLNFLYQTLTLS